MTAERALLRFLGVWAVLAGVELLERVAYRAGVEEGVDLAAAVVDDALAAVDVSDVVEAHAGCCGVPA